MRCAFTLIELLVVMAIISLLAAMLIAGVGGSQDLVDNKKCENILVLVGEGLNQYRTEYGFYPAPVAGTNNLGYALCHPEPSLPRTRAERDLARTTTSYPNDYLRDKLEDEFIKDDSVTWSTVSSTDVQTSPIPICDNFSNGGAYGQPLIYIYKLDGRAIYTGSDYNYDCRVSCQKGYQQEAELWSAGPDGRHDSNYHLHDLERYDNRDNLTMMPYK